MTFSELFDTPYTPEEYLAKKRRENGERCARRKARLMKNANDKAYVTALCKRLDEGSMKNMLVLPGTGAKPYDVGMPPAWYECRTGDPEYLFFLNRMSYFEPLLEAYLLTGEKKYAEKVISDLTNWVQVCPLPPYDHLKTHEDARHSREFNGLHPWRSLEAGIRPMYSFRTAYEVLLPTNLMTPALLETFVRTFHDHGRVLRDVSPLIWPSADHNHYLHEMEGLFVISHMFPEFREAAEWQTFSASEILRCAQNQITPEGGQVEGCPHYHNICLNMFLDAICLGKEYGVTFSDEFTDICRRAADYTAWTTRPDGILYTIGDSPFLKSAGTSAAKYYQAFGGFGEFEKLLPVLPPFDSETVPPEAEARARKAAEGAPGGYNYQKTLGQYIARTGWTPEDSSFIFVCNTPVVNGHSHQDPMSFELTLRGDDVIIDPSYYTYQNTAFRSTYKSPEYHSCLTFNEEPPFAYVDAWQYTPQKEGHTRMAYTLPGIYAADASHENYAPDEHRRLCALVDGDVFFVADDVKNVRGTDVRLYFHVNDRLLMLGNGVAGSARVRLLLPPLEAKVVASHKSPGVDREEPTCRLILKDTSHKRDALYLTVITKQRTDVGGQTIEHTDGGVKISFTVAGKERTFLWKFNQSLKEI